MNDFGKSVLQDLFRRLPELCGIAPEIEHAYAILEQSFAAGGTLFVCGNGGSAADSEHIAGELGKGFLQKRPLPEAMLAQLNEKAGEDITPLTRKLQQGLRCVPLTGQIALSTAFCNDVDPKLVYAQQLFSLARPGDVLMGISTSGNAENVLAAMKTAGGLGLPRILLSGAKGGLCRKYAECAVCVPADQTYRIQEYHLPIYHALCILLENRFFPAC